MLCQLRLPHNVALHNVHDLVSAQLGHYLFIESLEVCGSSINISDLPLLDVFECRYHSLVNQSFENVLFDDDIGVLMVEESGELTDCVGDSLIEREGLLLNDGVCLLIQLQFLFEQLEFLVKDIVLANKAI